MDDKDDDDAIALPFRDFCGGGGIIVVDVSPVWIRCNRSLVRWILSCDICNAGCRMRS